MLADAWPPLDLEQWLPTFQTLHRWMQIVGKVRLNLAPFEDHWWHSALCVTVRGVSTSPMPCERGILELEFDFINDLLVAYTDRGESRTVGLANKSVADFYGECRELLDSLGVQVHMVPWPNELPDATPFADDRDHATYDGDAVRRWWQATIQADRLLKRFRGGFAGKCSPSHLWWGAMDLACTRFSGRRAPAHPGGAPNCPDYVMLESYSHECISAGWWPGTPGSAVAEPAFYAYAYPEPDGCAAARIAPSAAFYSRELREWILPYAAVRTAPDPDRLVMEFLETTYDTAATLGGWDVTGLRSTADVNGMAVGRR
ncbi:MAG TPA: DUF5996 family protein [Gemmatimonadaceae bacterium]